MPLYKHRVTELTQFLTVDAAEAHGGDEVFEFVSNTPEEDQREAWLEAVANKTEVEGLTVDAIGNQIGPNGEIQLLETHVEPVEEDLTPQQKAARTRAENKAKAEAEAGGEGTSEGEAG